MKITPQNNRTIKRVSILIILGAAIAASSTAIARADGNLTAQEQQFGDDIAQSLCDYIDVAGVTTASMSKSMKIIYQHTPASMDMSDAVDIINYVVSTYCPSHWAELVTFGDAVRHA